jgi:hypothetical protein
MSRDSQKEYMTPICLSVKTREIELFVHVSQKCYHIDLNTFKILISTSEILPYIKIFVCIW